MLDLQEYTNLPRTRELALIAEFMGYSIKDFEANGLKYIVSEDRFILNTIVDVPYWDWSLVTGLKYDSQWNELMPVIDKLNEIDRAFHFASFKKYYSMSVDSSKKFHRDFKYAHAIEKKAESTISGAYELIVHFLTWYKNNKHK